MHAHSTARPAIATREDRDTGTVVAPHDQAVQAGLAMYEQGGNAVDAAVAAALVSGVIEPTETTLAGSGFIVLAEDGREPLEVDFGPMAPLAATDTMFELEPPGHGAEAAVLGLAPVTDNANVDGPLASGVPRTLLGLVTAQGRFGTLSRAAVLAPAIEAAHSGYRPDGWHITATLSDLDRLRADPMARRVYLDERGMPKGWATDAGYGQTFGTYPAITQPALGRTLEHVAHHGAESLTHGEIASALTESSSSRGGILTREDLERSVPTIREARLLRYRDATVAASYAPSGALTELQALAIWQRAQPGGTLPSASGAALRRLALALRHAFADRYHWLGDAALRPVPVEALLSEGYAHELARLVEQGHDVSDWEAGAPWLTYSSRAVHDPWRHTSAEAESPTWQPATANEPTSGTTHVSAADAEGRVVSITHTAANHFGSGIVCPRTGLLFDSSMAWFNAAPGAANSIAPGARALANMGPVVVLHGDGTKSAIGASGGRRIVSAVAQLVIALVDGRMTAEQALAAPRVDASGQSLIVPESLHRYVGDVADLGVRVIPETNDPYPMDFSRPNIARALGSGRTESAIAASQHNS